MECVSFLGRLDAQALWGAGRVRGVIGIGVELLAAIPSVVYGLWALFIMGPWLYEHVGTPLSEKLGQPWDLAPGVAGGDTRFQLLARVVDVRAGFAAASILALFASLRFGSCAALTTAAALTGLRAVAGRSCA